MILTAEKIIDAHSKNGVWGHVTLDGLFAKNAEKHPERIALVDSPLRTDWTGGAPRRLTYAQADAEVSRLASVFAAVGLTTDNVIGLQAPNTVDSVISMLAALRAGLVVAPLPLHWRQKEVLEAMSRAGAKAFIAADRCEPRLLGEEARDFAADLFSLRFVFGLGSNMPDGVIELSTLLGDDGEGLQPPKVQREKNPADHVATLTWAQSTSGEPLPVARSHNHWIAAGLMTFLESGLTDGARIVLPYSLCGMVGIGAGLTPWLMSAGTLHLDHATRLRNLADHVDSVEADYVLCPGPLAINLDRKLHTDCQVAAVWAPSSPPPRPLATNRRVTDLHVADEFAIIAKSRDGSKTPLPIKLGNVGAPSQLADAPSLVEISLDSDEPNPTLKLGGPMVANSPWPSCKVQIPTDKAGFVDTLLPVRFSEKGVTGFGVSGQIAPGIRWLPALDQLYCAFPGLEEGAAFLVEDEILGARLYAALVPKRGAPLDPDSFFGFLEASKVGLTAIPHRLLSLQKLPRTAFGRVDRDALAARMQRLHVAVA